MSGSRPWYKRFPGDFITGTLAFSLEEKGAYSICLDLIYDRGGPIPDDPQWISRACGCSVRKWKTIRQTLIDAGKLVPENGTLSNDRARKLLENSAKEARKLAENGLKGAEKTNEKRATLNGNNDLPKKGPQKTERQSRGYMLEAICQIEESKEPPLPPTDLADVFSIWNETAEQCGLPKAQVFTKERQTKALARLKECGGIDGWRDAMKQVSESAFLTGDNRDGWRAGFDFVLQKKSFTKLMEGGYEGKAREPTKSPHTKSFDSMEAALKIFEDQQ